MRLLLCSCLLALQAHATQLTVKLEPRWDGRPLALNDTKLADAAGNKLSVTRLAMLLSHAELQRESGQWIGARDWVEFVDAGKGRLSFVLNGIPAERFKALHFDLGLDEAMDKSDPATRPANHPLNPDLNALHWSWRGQYVFFAIEGRYEQPDHQLGGYSYHLAGQPCRGTINVPVEMDLRGDLLLTLSFHADRVFSAQHRIDITAADSTHSGNDGGLASRLADNAVQAFGVVRLEPDLSPKAEAPAASTAWQPPLLAGRIPAHFPQTEFPKDNVLTPAGTELGRVLFNDKRLSFNNSQSCGDCHSAARAFSDTRAFSLGAAGQPGKRNAMPLFNLAWKPAFFWDGRSPTLRDQVLHPIQDPVEMNEKLERLITKLTDLAPQFEKAFGSPGITSERIALALEQHLLTLISASSRMDRTVTGNEKLTELEQRGFQLFFTESDPGHGVKGADCFHCHGGAHFTNNQFLNNGLDDDASLKDEGLAGITHKPSDRGKFMVPSLRNVARTAPYMHDGRFDTLEDVIEHYDHGLKRSATLDPNLAKHLRYDGLHLTAEDKAALVAFLKTLTDESFPAMAALPSGPPR